MPSASSRPEALLRNEDKHARVFAPLENVRPGDIEPPCVESDAPRLLGFADERIASQMIQLEEDVQLTDLVVRTQGGRSRRSRTIPFKGGLGVPKPRPH